MPFSLVAHTAASSADTTTSTTAALNTNGANLIVLGISSYIAETPTTPSDSKSNTWTPLTLQSAGQANCKMWYCLNPIVSAPSTTDHTFTYSSLISYAALTVSAWSGVDSFHLQSGSTATGTTIQPGSINPSPDIELIIAVVAFGANAATASIDSSYIETDEVTPTSGITVGGTMAYLIQPGAGATNPTWTISVSGDLATTLASFKAAGTPGGPLVNGGQLDAVVYSV